MRADEYVRFGRRVAGLAMHHLLRELQRLRTPCSLSAPLKDSCKIQLSGAQRGRDSKLHRLAALHLLAWGRTQPRACRALALLPRPLRSAEGGLEPVRAIRRPPT